MAKSMKRRCLTHDYRSRSIYMITISKAPGIPNFSEVYGDPQRGTTACHVRYFPLGCLITEQLRSNISSFRDARNLQYIIMPDHIHFVIFIEKDVDYHVGELINEFKSNCTRQNSMQPIFEEDYNDRICWRSNQLDRMIKYVRDNPRRLLMRRLHPEYFRSRHYVTIGGKNYEAYGNPILLSHPSIAAVRISSKYTPDRLAALLRLWEEVIRQTGVLVSPFISQAKRAVRDKAIANGCSLIYFTKAAFGEKYKPQGELFDLCAQGRLLLISLGDEADSTPSITRREAMRMNELAHLLVKSL